MPLNRPVLDSRRYNVVPAVVVLLAALVLTVIYPDIAPLAAYIIQPGTSALRDTSILATRSLVNAVVWGALTYFLLRVSERLRHKDR